MKKFLAFAIALISIPIFSQNLDYQELLERRLKNDSLYTQIKNNWQMSKNNYKATQLGAYLATDLSTGSVNLALSADKEQRGFSISPSLGLSSPMLNNLGFQISMPYSNFASGSKTEKGFSADLFFDIYSQTRNRTALQVENARYNLSLAEEKLKMQEELIEKKLLGEIKKIFGEYSALLASRMQLSMEDLKYRKTLTQGYSKNSPKLRTAKLSMMRAKRSARETEFNFFSNLEIFAQSFGITIKPEDIDDFFMKLALSIPEKAIPKIENLSETNFKAIISANREHEIFLRQNKINRNIFSARANAKFSMNNQTQNNPISNQSINSKSKNIQAGINMTFPGCQLYTGAIFTLDAKDKLNPNIQLNLSFNPIQLYEQIIKIKNIKLNETNKLIELAESKIKLKKSLEQFKIKKEKLEWQQKLYSEELQIYKKNSLDHDKWFKQGMINELENRQAKLEYLDAILRKSNASIDVLIFNIEINENFKNVNSK